MPGLADLGALIAAKDWARAEAVLRRAAGGKDAGAAVFYNLAKVLVEGGKAEQAGTWFRRAIKADPRHQAARFELGRWLVGRGALAEAQEAFAAAWRLEPGDGDAARNLGRVALRRGDWAAARAAFAAVLEGAPGDGEALAGAYRAAAELRHGPEAEALRARLAADPSLGAQHLKAITRVSAGRVPLRG